MYFRRLARGERPGVWLCAALPPVDPWRLLALPRVRASAFVAFSGKARDLSPLRPTMREDRGLLCRMSSLVGALAGSAERQEDLDPNKFRSIMVDCNIPIRADFDGQAVV
jgi:hypothetical protein